MIGGSGRAEKSRKVLMMMKAAKLGWAETGVEQEQGRSRVKHSKAERGQKLGRSRAGAGQEQVGQRGFG